MEQRDQLLEVGRQVWEFRREKGFSKALPLEIREAVAEMIETGVPCASIVKALGVTRTTITEWGKRYSKPKLEKSSVAEFSEVAVVDERPTYEIKLA